MKNHKHSEHGVSQERFLAAQKSTWVSLVVNVVLSVLQIVIGLMANSQALVADGLHSLSDLMSDVLVLFVNRRSHQTADAQHPYGHARMETAATLLLGAALFALGIGLLIAAAWALHQGQASQPVGVLALGIALFTLLAKEGLFRYLLAVAKRVRSQMLVANAWHSRSDAASSLVVVIGVGGNMLGFAYFDLLAAAVVGGMIAHMGGKLAWESLSELIDTGLDDADVKAIRATLLAVPGVCGVHALRTRKMANDAMVDVHIEVDPRFSVSEGHYIAEAAERAVLQQHHVCDVVVHIDPRHVSTSEYCSLLPSRAELITQLQPFFPMLELQKQRLMLHYFEDVVEIEIFIDAAQVVEQAVLLRACRAAQQQIQVIRHIAPVWCGM